MAGVTQTSFVVPIFDGEPPVVNVVTHGGTNNPNKVPPQLQRVWVFTNNNSHSGSYVHKIEIWKTERGISKVILVFRNTKAESIKAKLAPLNLSVTHAPKAISYMAEDPVNIRHLIEIFNRNVQFTASAQTEMQAINRQLLMDQGKPKENPQAKL